MVPTLVGVAGGAAGADALLTGVDADAYSTVVAYQRRQQRQPMAAWVLKTAPTAATVRLR
jgi:hypothetical protein